MLNIKIKSTIVVEKIAAPGIFIELLILFYTNKHPYVY